MTRQLAQVVALLSAVALAAGCGQTVDEKGEDMDPLEQLEQRPRESETETRYLRALTSFQDRVAEEVGVSWDQVPRRTGMAGCGEPFSGLGGVSFTVRGGTSTDAFDMARWSDVEAIADAVAAEEGFTADKVVLVDEPDHKKVTWIDEHGAELEIGAQKALVPAVYGACVLP